MSIIVSELQMRKLRLRDMQDICPITQLRAARGRVMNSGLSHPNLNTALGAFRQAGKLTSSSILSPVNVLPEEGLAISSSFYHWPWKPSISSSNYLDENGEPSCFPGDALAQPRKSCLCRSRCLSLSLLDNSQGQDYLLPAAPLYMQKDWGKSNAD